MSIGSPQNMLFSSRFNILKIYAQDTTILSLPGSSKADYLIYVHGLNYVPRARVWYEPISGQIWPLGPEQYLSSGGGTGTQLNVIGMYKLQASTNALYVRLSNLGGAPVSVNIYWRVYADS